MSNVYIRPRNQPQQQQRNQPQQHLLVGGQQRPLLPATPTATRVVRTSSHLVGAGNHRQVLRSQPYPTFVEKKSMGRPGCRRVYLAQPNSNIAAAYPPMIGHHSRQPAYGRPIFTVASASPMNQQQSEEDEFDVEEVYRLLEESAGHRMEQDAGTFPPRRRQRLTNLTAEEKMDRRKEKNRIAAQAARDRKKEMNKRLEDSLKKALLEIGRLKSEVKFLRAENAQLQMQQPIQHHQMQMNQQEPIMNVHHRHHQPNPTAATAIGQHAVNHCPQPPQQQSEDSLGSAVGTGIRQQPQQRRRTAETEIDQQQQQWRSAQQQQQLSMPTVEGNGNWTETTQKNGNEHCQQRAEIANGMHDEGADGTLVNCEHPEGGDSEDFKLQHIFDELFEELDIPVDVDRFCNEVIEEGIAAQNLGHGHGQTAEIVPMSAATIGGTFDGHKSECPRKAETTIMPIDAYGREGGEEYGFQHGNGHRGGGGGGNGHCATAEAALSPHNYFAQPPQEEEQNAQQKNYLNKSSSNFPQSESAQHSFSSSNSNSNHSQQQHFYSTIDNSSQQTIIVADTAFQQMVPSPIDDQPYSSQNSPFDGTLDFGHDYGHLNALEDQMLYGEESKGFGHSMDFDSNGIFGHGNNGNSLLEWPDNSEDFATLEPNGISGDILGLSFQSDDLSTDLLLSDF